MNTLCIGGVPMHLFTVLFVGIVANIDNLVIGCSYGLKQTRISTLPNFIIAAISMLSSLIALLVGHWISSYFKVSFANDLGGCLLILIGGLTIWSTTFEHSKKFNTNSKFLRVIYEPKTADLDENKIISLKESFLLGIALALNSIGTSFSVGLTTTHILVYIISIGFFSLIFITIGVTSGIKISQSLNGIELFAPIISGLLLIAIGLYEIIF